MTLCNFTVPLRNLTDPIQSLAVDVNSISALSPPYQEISRFTFERYRVPTQLHLRNGDVLRVAEGYDEAIRKIVEPT